MMTNKTSKGISKQYSQKGTQDVSASSLSTMDSMDSPLRSYQIASPQLSNLNGAFCYSKQSISENFMSQNYHVLQKTSLQSKNNSQNKLENPLIVPINKNNQLKNDELSLKFDVSNEKKSQLTPYQKISNQSIFGQIKGLNEKRFNNDESKEEEEEEEEEEYCVWDEERLEEMGVDVNELRNKSGEPLTFYQLYRLRSYAYQPEYVSRMETINHINVISKHYDREITMKILAREQQYLDKHFAQQSSKQQLPQTLRKQGRSKPTKKVNNNNELRNQGSQERSYQPIIRRQLNKNCNIQQKEFDEDKCNSVRQLIVNREYERESGQERVVGQRQQQTLAESVNETMTHHQRQKYYSSKRKQLRIQHQQFHQIIESENVPIKELSLNQLQYACYSQQSTFDDELFSSPRIFTTIYDSLTTPLYTLNKLTTNNEQINQSETQLKGNKGINLAQTTQSVLKYLQLITSEKQSKPISHSVKKNRFTFAEENIKTVHIDLSLIK